jgi:hypothetical protein
MADEASVTVRNDARRDSEGRVAVRHIEPGGVGRGSGGIAGNEFDRFRILLGDRENCITTFRTRKASNEIET